MSLGIVYAWLKVDQNVTTYFDTSMENWDREYGYSADDFQKHNYSVAGNPFFHLGIACYLPSTGDSFQFHKPYYVKSLPKGKGGEVTEIVDFFQDGDKLFDQGSYGIYHTLHGVQKQCLPDKAKKITIKEKVFDVDGKQYSTRRSDLMEVVSDDYPKYVHLASGEIIAVALFPEEIIRRYKKCKR